MMEVCVNRVATYPPDSSCYSSIFCRGSSSSKWHTGGEMRSHTQPTIVYSHTHTHTQPTSSHTQPTMVYSLANRLRLLVCCYPVNTSKHSTVEHTHTQMWEGGLCSHIMNINDPCTNVLYAYLLLTYADDPLPFAPSTRTATAVAFLAIP